MYKCLNCRKSIDLAQVKEKIRCPYCGFKILIKERPKTIVKVQAK